MSRYPVIFRAFFARAKKWRVLASVTDIRPWPLSQPWQELQVESPPKLSRADVVFPARSNCRFPRLCLVATIIFPHTKWLSKTTDYRDTAASIICQLAFGFISHLLRIWEFVRWELRMEQEWGRKRSEYSQSGLLKQFSSFWWRFDVSCPEMFHVNGVKWAASPFFESFAIDEDQRLEVANLNMALKFIQVILSRCCNVVVNNHRVCSWILVLVDEASLFLWWMRETVVTRVCTRQQLGAVWTGLRHTTHRQWLWNEKAIPVLARRRSKILAAGMLQQDVSFHSFYWKHLCCRNSKSKFFSTNSLTHCLRFFYSISKFSGVQKKRGLTKKLLWSFFNN